MFRHNLITVRDGSETFAERDRGVVVGQQIVRRTTRPTGSLGIKRKGM